ncbi:porin [Burkholderia cenocepacia]|uniref:porin n=1 Tax=Burkholderia cenocepacia TaxID=95486 RepID=UPI002AB71187|nr:porin [Burkholderia cenocepacia]
MLKTREFTRIIVFGVLCMAASGVQAQSAVTLYGIVDNSLLFTSKSVDPATGKNAGHRYSLTNGGLSPSVFGLKGSEDLGGGTSAIFALESGIDIANGGLADSDGNFFGREAWVGLAGDFGRVQMGVQFSPFLLSLVTTDPRNISYFGSEVPIYVGQLFATGAYNPNAVSYTSPTLGGLQAKVMFALGGAAGDFQAGRQYSASLTYTHGPLVVSAAMYDGNAGGTAATTPIPSTVPFTGRTIGASYNMGALTVNAVFVNYKLAGSFDNRVFGAGFMYSFTPAVNFNAGAWYISDGNDTNNRSILAAGGIVYSLSKATVLYSQVGFVNNRGKADTGISTNGALYAPAGSIIGATVGIRHMF